MTVLLFPSARNLFYAINWKGYPVLINNFSWYDSCNYLYSTIKRATFMQFRAVRRPGLFQTHMQLTVTKGAVMRKKFFLSLLTFTAVLMTFGLNQAQAAFPAPPGFPSPPGLPGVNVRVNGYLPPPPGVNVRIDAGRPYYVERERRIYIEEERPARHYKKYKKHRHDNDRHYRHDNGRHRGHYKQGRHGHDD